MKNKDMSRQFRNRMLVCMFIATLIACASTVLAVSVISLVNDYVRTSGGEAPFLLSAGGNILPGIMTAAIFGIVVFAVSFFLMMDRSLRYIGQISAAIQNISEGDLNTPIEIQGDDEFSVMAENLNRMQEDIRDLMDRERESERTKNELITNVAHDLRTPLTSVLGYLELLSRAENLSPDVRAKYTDIALAKAKRLEKLIEDLFDFTKMTYGKVNMTVSEVDIVKLLAQMVEEFYPSFKEKGLAYELRSNVNAKIITADANLMARLFGNLINNAIKYGADGKKILIRVRAREESVTVSVTNYGYVIPPAELPLIFNKFYRVERSRSVQTGGTGLGLAICKNIVDMHGGTIRVDSDLSGTVFTVRLKTKFDPALENFTSAGEETGIG